MSRRAISVVVVAFLALLQLTALGQAQEQPWVSDAALLDRAYAELQADGILAMEQYATEVEAALKRAPALFAEPTMDDGGAFTILTDGQTETLAALMAAEAETDADIVAVANPYPILALHLGTFYAEVGQFKDAMRVLNAGLKLSPVPDLMLGESMPTLLSERGYTLAQLKRTDEALASYDIGLGIGQMTDQQRARLHRGRGYVLVELERLDEAVAAYEASLELEPGNANAIGELEYIASIR